MQKFNILVLCAILGLSSAARFDNFSVYRVKVNDESQLNVMKTLEGNEDDYIFIEPPEHLNTIVEILVAPHKLEEFTASVEKYSLDVELTSSNFQAVLDAERPKRQTKAMDWVDYHPLAEIYSWMDSLKVDFSNVVTLFEIGSSYEGRVMRGIKLSFKTGNKAIFVESNIHAREWIASATATWTINELLRSQDPAVRDIAENYDWYFIPVANPDGYEYTQTEGNRLWRKTRTPQANGQFGVDPNRNFGFKWMEGGASSNPASETFAGPEPWSEVEVRNVADFYVTIAKDVVIYLAFHSHGRYLLFPLGTDSPPVANFDDLTTIAEATGEAVQKRYGTVYRVGNSKDVLYATSGTSVDWAYGAAQTKIGYTYEFRSGPVSGFILPPEQIVENSLETMDSLIVLINKTKELGYFD